jgi:hypothetical protein
MFKVKIESEIQKTKDKNVDKGNQLLNHANQLLLQQSTDETQVIENIGINKSLVEATNKRTSTHLERKELERKTGDNIFTIEEIKTMCVKYRLKFLQANEYVGAIPPDLGARIVDLKKKHNLNINESSNSDSGKFFIMAPPSCFKLREAEAIRVKLDPVMFYRIGEGLYILVHKWGKDFTYWRRWLGIMMENTQRVQWLRFALFASCSVLVFYFTLTMLHESMQIAKEGDLGSFFILLAIVISGVILSIRQSFFATAETAGSMEGWRKNEKTWRKVKTSF